MSEKSRIEKAEELIAQTTELAIANKIMKGVLSSRESGIGVDDLTGRMMYVAGYVSNGYPEVANALMTIYEAD